jgi:hypothetical protein
MIYICITATNRPDLHKISLESYTKFFNLNNYDQLTWIINIDIIDKLDFTYEETKNGYIESLNYFYPKSNVIFLEKSENPSFCKAVKKLGLYVDNLLKLGDKLFWLEDDWKFNGENIIDYNILKHYLDDYTAFHMFWKCRADNLYPILRGYNEAKVFTNAIIKFEDTNKDPEGYLMKNYPKVEKNFEIFIVKKNLEEGYVTGGMRHNIKRYLRKGSTVKDILNLNEIPKNTNNKTRHIAFNMKMSKDLGRKYMESKNLRKWTRKGDEIETNYHEIEK